MVVVVVIIVTDGISCDVNGGVSDARYLNLMEAPPSGTRPALAVLAFVCWTFSTCLCVGFPFSVQKIHESTSCLMF